MSVDLIITLIRALIVAALTILLAVPLARRLRSGSTVIWIFAVLPFLVPPLLTGYTYTNAHGVLGWPMLAREGFYALLLVCRHLGPAAIVLALARPKIGASSRFALRMMTHPSLAMRMRTWFLGPGTGIVIAVLLVFLLAFLEFELASFFLVGSWSVKLFDAQVGGQQLATSLQQAGGPFVIAALLLAGLIWRFRASQRLPDVESEPSRPGSSWPLWPALFLLFAWPLFDLLRDSLQGVQPLVQDFSIHREVLTSLGFALVAAWLAGHVVASERTAFRLVLTALPGLFGSLIIGLVLLRLFQQAVLHFAYDTPAPLLLGMIFSLLPMAVLLHLLADKYPHSGAFTAEMAHRPGAIRWVLVTRRKLAGFLSLFCLGWFDLTLGSLLAPSGMTPITARLYNFMHYGQSQVLSAMVLVTLLLPLLVMGFIYLTRRAWALSGR
ncbi:MAG: ABC-type Fe3+ transport system permease subunit [Kiritimatiellia bacterium]|jgi:ABC-type Fe3+ transport system permease subunit